MLGQIKFDTLKKTKQQKTFMLDPAQGMTCLRARVIKSTHELVGNLNQS
jgi:hypothetical protein